MAQQLPDGTTALAACISHEIQAWAAATAEGWADAALHAHEAAISVVLQAYTDDALLLLLIEHGHFNYLELAPLTTDDRITVFPPPERVQA